MIHDLTKRELSYIKCINLHRYWSNNRVHRRKITRISLKDEVFTVLLLLRTGRLDSLPKMILLAKFRSVSSYVPDKEFTSKINMYPWRRRREEHNYWIYLIPTKTIFDNFINSILSDMFNSFSLMMTFQISFWRKSGKLDWLFGKIYCWAKGESCFSLYGFSFYSSSSKLCDLERK